MAVPKGAGGGSATGFASFNDGSTIYDVVYSLDVANDTFLKLKEITITTIIPFSKKTVTPANKQEFDQLKNDPIVQNVLFTDIGRVKGTLNAAQLKEATDAANVAQTQNTWNVIPANNLPQHSNNSSTYTGVPMPAANVVKVAPMEQIGAGESTEFITSIQGPVNFISLKYPIDANYGGFKDPRLEQSIVGGQDHLVIEQFLYRAPQEGLFTSGGSLVSTLVSGLKKGSNLKEYLGIVRLPIPNNLSMSNGVDWGDSRVNPIEAGAFFAANAAASQALGTGNVIDLFTNSFKGLGEFFDAVKGGAFGQGTQAGTMVSAFLAQYGLGKIGINVDPAQFIARGTGNTINPNLELLFSGPKLRSFSFQFKFAPNSEIEANECRRILRFFKQGMAAKIGTDDQLFLGSPNVFRLRYLTKDNEPIRSLPRYKICALTTTDIDYSPGPTYQSYDDGSAGSQTVMMNMTLNFTELTPIFESDYRKFDSEGQKDIFDTITESDNLIGPMSKINSTDVGF